MKRENETVEHFYYFVIIVLDICDAKCQNLALLAKIGFYDITNDISYDITNKEHLFSFHLIYSLCFHATTIQSYIYQQMSLYLIYANSLIREKSS